MLKGRKKYLHIYYRESSIYGTPLWVLAETSLLVIIEIYTMAAPVTL